jgi:hypothetical protein
MSEQPEQVADQPESEPVDAQTADDARRQWDDTLWYRAPIPRYRP